jgi:predicted dehydrogenase
MAIVGLGAVGRFQLERWSDSPLVELSAIYDEDAQARQRFGHLCGNLIADFDALLAIREIDAVLLDVPIARRFHFGREILSAGKHLVVPLPVASTLRETLSLWRAAEASKRQIIAWHWLTDRADSSAAAAVSHSGVIGDLRSLRFERREPSALPQTADGSVWGEQFFGELLEECLRLADRPAKAVFAVPIGESGIACTIIFPPELVATLTFSAAGGPRLDSGWSIHATMGGYARGRKWLRTGEGEVFDVPFESARVTDLDSEIRDVLKGRANDPSHRQMIRHAALFEAVMRSLQTGQVAQLEAAD